MLTRRHLFAGCGAIVGALALATTITGAATAAEIKVLNWQGYGTDEKWAIDAFEKKTGIKVTHDYFNSEQEMLTKLRTAPGTYDVVLMNNIYVPEAAKEGLIQPIDENKISNFADLTPSLRDSERFVMDGKHMAISWVWGLTSFAYNTNSFKQAPDSISGSFDDTIKPIKLTWRDDALEAVQIAALATGQDMNKPADLPKIKEWLITTLKPRLKAFWSSEDEWNKMFSAGDFDIGTYWSGSAARSKKAFKLPVGFMVPKEGAIGWYDGLTVAAKAPNLDGALAFIDFMVSPDFYVPWDTNVGAPASANAKANAMLPEDAMNRMVLGNPEIVARVKWMAPTTDDQRKAYQELWDEVKTAIAN